MTVGVTLSTPVGSGEPTPTKSLAEPLVSRGRRGPTQPLPPGSGPQPWPSSFPSFTWSGLPLLALPEDLEFPSL